MPMSRIEVIRVQTSCPENPSAQFCQMRYEFTVFEETDNIVVILENIFRDVKPTKRHNWQTKLVYARLGHAHNNKAETKVEPDLAPDITEEAVRKVRETVCFKKWEDHYR